MTRKELIRRKTKQTTNQTNHIYIYIYRERERERERERVLHINKFTCSIHFNKD